MNRASNLLRTTIAGREPGLAGSHGRVHRPSRSVWRSPIRAIRVGKHQTGDIEPAQSGNGVYTARVGRESGFTAHPDEFGAACPTDLTASKYFAPSRESS
ncbi:hypothetical protein [Nevskia sp.]|uniref:hypothetical protein n=1 Tax=Nevskia sp. TaxID=1929292 RepID=UPI0025FCADA4|nr:hypothetical protein [Nevskia sp.]